MKLSSIIKHLKDTAEIREAEYPWMARLMKTAATRLDSEHNRVLKLMDLLISQEPDSGQWCVDCFLEFKYYPDHKSAEDAVWSLCGLEPPEN